LRAGRLKKKITIQQPTETKDSAGALQTSWSTFAIVWAEVTPQTGREFRTAQQVNAEITIVFRIRYLKSVTPKMRISWDSRIFDIESIVNIMEKNEQLLLNCKEVL